jgi:hypothetical protein
VGSALGADLELQAAGATCGYKPPGTQSLELGVSIGPFPADGSPYETLARTRAALEQNVGEMDARFVEQPSWGNDAFSVTQTAAGHPVGQVSAFSPEHTLLINLPAGDYDVHAQGAEIADKIVKMLPR